MLYSENRTMLTREEFQPIYEQGFEAVWAVIQALQRAHQALEARVKELEDRLGKDSHNSSKPPSSDGYKQKTVSLRENTGRKSGGQPGHPGKTLAFVAEPDALVLHSASHCTGCGGSLAEVAGVQAERRQVLDLPPLSVVATEHRSLHKSCPHCGKHNLGAFPEEVACGVSYGSNLKALALYFHNYQLLPSARIAQMFSDLFSATFSEGTLFSCQQKASSRLEGFLASVRTALLAAPVDHFDETGLRVCGKLHWLHSASTEDATLYTCHPKRGKAGMESGGVLAEYSGVAVHDGWASYRNYGCGHALCNAHHLRELTALYEQEKQEWAQAMRSVLVAIKKSVQESRAQGETHLPPRVVQDYQTRYQTLLTQGFLENPQNLTVSEGKRGRTKQSKGYNLLKRLEQGKEQVLRFMYDFLVPFDNNLAERDIRMMKVQQKVSGGFRSVEGADAFCRIRSYISTVRKQGHSVLPALQRLLLNKPLLTSRGA